MSIEAMKQALEAMKKGVDGQTSIEMDEAITSLSQAIAGLESQEQNFCPRCGKRTNDIHTCTPPQRSESSGKPSAWVGLTDDEIAEIGFESADRESAVIQTIDKLKEKNT